VTPCNAADLFVCPSIFEGFDLPPLEAMACATPVVTSNTSSFPEGVADAILIVDPLDIEALSSSGGVLIVDDYGSWKGARKAVDKYLRANHISLLLNRIDDTGRIGVKRQRFALSHAIWLRRWLPPCAMTTFGPSSRPVGRNKPLPGSSWVSTKRRDAVSHGGFCVRPW
jgi:glycosyltransferase involved in cell wall biosynthesis